MTPRPAPRIHYFQHAEHEGLGCIEAWLERRGLAARRTRGYAGESFPEVAAFDWLIVLGGPMNIYEEAEYPWLKREKQVINDAIVTNKKILGLCLGAQLVADLLGGPVTKNEYKEIGWFDVEMTGDHEGLISDLPRRFSAFHWHGDTFKIPPGCRNLMKSDACVNQSFAKGHSLLGLQFHLEVRQADAQAWLELDEPRPDRYVQSAEQILADPARFEMNNRLMDKVLDRMLAA